MKRSRLTWSVVVLLLLSIPSGVLSTVAASGSTSSTVLPTSPPGQLLIVTNNINETGASDVADPTDMYNLAQRLAEILPFAPDVLLTSESYSPAADSLAQALTDVLGHTYVVAVGSRDFRDIDADRDSAILLNLDTMRARNSGGYVVIDRPTTDKGAAHLLVKELKGGARAALLSVHVGIPSDAEMDYWMRAVGTALVTTYPNPADRQVENVAGDFNARRCLAPGPETLDCDTKPFWRFMTEELKFTDSIFSAAPWEIGQESKRIDYIFHRGPVLSASSDTEYDSFFTTPTRNKCKTEYNKGLNPEGCERFYSDHRLLWALVRADYDSDG
jgi:hypothetical protein